jgi:hypothetical protein
MAIAALSTAGFSQYIALTSDVGGAQQAWKSLEQNLAAGNLSAAVTAFDSYQQVSRNSTSSGSAASGSQLSSDMTALGSALSSGSLSDAQQAFTTVQNDLKSQPPIAVENAESAVAQTVDEVDALLDFPDAYSASSSATDPTTAILDSAYGLASTSAATDPDLALLEANYGRGAGSTPASAAENSSAGAVPGAGNAGSGASVNVYA